MPDLNPFRAVTYGPAAGDPGALLAPPYDVIDRAEADELRERSPHNSVRLVLPRGDDEHGDDGKYANAAGLLARWLEEDVLREASRPALHIYAQSFTHQGGRLTRHGLFGALRARPFSEGEVIPHEETHGAAKRDRLALMESCRAQLSPVFLIARDGGDELRDLLVRATRREPASFEATTPDGTVHRMWRIEDPAAVEELRTAAGAEPLLIADGHHRYETALELGRRHPEWSGSDRVLSCVVPRGDEGLLLLPTHRSLREPPPGRSWTEALRDGFEVEAREAATPGELVPGSEPDGSATLVVLLPGEDDETSRRAAILRARADALADAGLAPPESGVPSVLLDRLLLRRAYGTDPDRAAEAGLLGYHRDPSDAVRAAGSVGAAFLLPPMRLETVWSIARKGGRLPPKSTYFWPKLPSGLLFRRL